MMVSQGLRKKLSDFKNSPEGTAFDLRLDLADIILRHLDENGITQAVLAERAGIKPQQITRLVHSDANCTFDTAGRVLFAIGIRGRLIEVPQTPASTARPSWVTAISTSASGSLGISQSQSFYG